jgi:hypothetical protein
MIREENKMKKKFNASKKSMRVLITILITLVCVNSALMIATMIASATVNPAAAQETELKNFSGTKVSDRQVESLMAKAAAQAKSESAAMKEAAEAKEKATASTTTKSTTTKSTATTAKATTTKSTTTKSTTTEPTTTNTKAANEPETTTTTAKPEATTTTATATATSTSSSSSGISTLKSSVHSALINAFDKLEFKIVINPNSKYLGYFSTSKHSLEMRSVSVSTFRHEMGHFLDVLKNMPSRSSQFAGIYSREKSKYTGTNAAYITKNAQEYFAQSYRNYLENASKLKSERPETYAFIKAKVWSITSTDINRTYNMYSWSW